MARLHFQVKEKDQVDLRDIYCFDSFLSFRAKGLLSFLYWLDRDSTFDFKDFKAFSADPPGAVRASFKELETLGYISRRMLRDKNGRFVTIEYTVQSKPKKRSIEGFFR